MACADLAECDDLTVCVPPQLWSAMPSLEGEEVVECEEFRVIGKFQGQNQNSNPESQPKLPGAHQRVLFFRAHLG